MKRIALICTVLLLATSAWAANPAMKRKISRPHGFLSGTVQFGDKPICGIVSFFNILSGPPPNEGATRRIPQRVGKSDAQGHFRLAVSPGTYFIGAMEAATDRPPGPPQPGEKFIFAVDKEKKMMQFTVANGEEKDIGIISAPLSSFKGTYENYFTIKGKVLYENNKPFPGALVLIRKDFRNHRPLFISKRTDPDGHYELQLPPGSHYYIFARQTLQSAGRPIPGSYIGTYGEDQPKFIFGQSAGSPPKTISGQKGDLVENIDIIMFKVPTPEEESVKRQTEAGAPKITPVNPSKGDMPGSSTTMNAAQKGKSLDTEEGHK